METVRQAQNFFAIWCRAEEKSAAVTFTLNGDPHTIPARRLTQGDNKSVYPLDEGRMLLLPANASPFYTKSSLDVWREVMQQEIAANRVLKQLGLLGPEYQTATLALGEGTVQGMVSRSFSSFIDDGIEVRDRNHPSRRYGDTMLFGSHANLKSPDYLFRVCEPLMADFAKMYLANVKIEQDCVNFAVQHASSAATASPDAGDAWKLRLFPFDMRFNPDPVPAWEAGSDEERHGFLRQNFSRNALAQLQLGLGFVFSRAEMEMIARQDGVDLHQLQNTLSQTFADPELREKILSRMEDEVIRVQQTNHPVLRMRSAPGNKGGAGATR